MDCATAAAEEQAQKTQHKEILWDRLPRGMRESISRRINAEPAEELTLERTLEALLPPGSGRPRLLTFPRSLSSALGSEPGIPYLVTPYRLSIQTLPHTLAFFVLLALSKNSSLLFSSDSALSAKNNGG